MLDEGEGIDPADLPHVKEPYYLGEGGSGGHVPQAGMDLGRSPTALRGPWAHSSRS